MRKETKVTPDKVSQVQEQVCVHPALVLELQEREIPQRIHTSTYIRWKYQAKHISANLQSNGKGFS